VQREWIGVAPEFADANRHALCHQAGNERDIARQAVQLRDTRLRRILCAKVPAEGARLGSNGL
jgi:hypothetical protein